MSCDSCGKCAEAMCNGITAEMHVISDVILGGLRFRTHLFPQQGTLVAQHIHDYDHVSWIPSGKARVFAGSKMLGEFGPHQGVEIKGGIPHRFVTLLPDTALQCVHRVAPEISGFGEGYQFTIHPGIQADRVT